jgi:type IV secretion system protein TrbL
MEINVLTTTLTTFVNAIHSGQKTMHSAGNGVLCGLAAIEIVLAGIWIAMDGTNVSGPFKKLLQLSFWIYFSNNFISLCDTFRDSLVQLGLSAGGQGGNYKILFDPSSIGGLAMDVTSPIVQSMHEAGITHLGDTCIMAICFAALILCFFLIACQICLAVIEYYLVVTLASVLIPFGISGHTKFIAEKAIGAAIAVSVKLMVLSFIMGLAQPVIAQMHFTGSGEITLNQMISMLLVSGLLAYIVWRAPAMAADLLAASPSLNAGAVGQSMVSGISAGVGAFTGAVTGGRAAGAALMGNVSAASQMLREKFGGGGGEPGGGAPGGGGSPLARGANPSAGPSRSAGSAQNGVGGGASSSKGSDSTSSPQGSANPRLSA